MKVSFISAAAVLCFGSASHAGCYNWEDNNYADPEHHLICFKDKCDITRIDFICSNIDDSTRGFEVGWQIGQSIDPFEKYASWQGVRIPQDQHKNLRCFEFTDETLMHVIGKGNCWDEPE